MPAAATCASQFSAKSHWCWLACTQKHGVTGRRQHEPGSRRLPQRPEDAGGCCASSEAFRKSFVSLAGQAGQPCGGRKVSPQPASQCRSWRSDQISPCSAAGTVCLHRRLLQSRLLPCHLLHRPGAGSDGGLGGSWRRRRCQAAQRRVAGWSGRSLEQKSPDRLPTRGRAAAREVRSTWPNQSRRHPPPFRTDIAINHNVEGLRPTRSSIQINEGAFHPSLSTIESRALHRHSFSPELCSGLLGITGCHVSEARVLHGGVVLATDKGMHLCSGT